jgi:ribosomal protein S25
VTGAERDVVSHHSEQIRRILEDIAAESAVSQRILARRLGIALGLTNQLLRRLSSQGLVTTVRARGNRLIYALTAAGSEEHMRLSRDHLNRSLATYSAVRDRIRRRLVDIAEQRGRDMPRVVFYGWGEAAEIGTACATEAGVRLVGVVDDRCEPAGTPRGVRLCSPQQLTERSLGGEPFDWILVTALSRTQVIQRQLDEIGLPRDRVSWL